MKSKIYGVILVFILLGYTFFFTSSLFFHQPQTYIYSTYGTKQNLSETVSIQLEQWTYSPKEHQMSVLFSLESKSIREISINMAAKSDTSRMPVRFIYPTGNLLVVLIDNVPSGFQQTTLMLQLASSENDVSNKVISFYATPQSVESVDSIEEGDTDYRFLYLTLQIEEKQQQIKELLEENQSLEKSNEEYTKAIEDLIANQEYETKEEIEVTNSRIKEYRNQISSNESTITQNKYSIEELKSNISNIEETIKKQQQKNAEEKRT